MSSLPQAGHAASDDDAIRSRILEAAEGVFAARGYAGSTTREIAHAAGIRKRMLFYYFPRKDGLYRAALERIVTGLVAVHERFRNEPGPIGLAEAVEGLTVFAAANGTALKLLLREIMDAGPHLRPLARRHIRPLFERGAAEVRSNMARGVFREGDPMHVLVNVGSLTLFYFLLVPLLRLVWDRDPLASATLAARAAEVRRCLMSGLAGPAAGEGRST
jgi:TetR/AcrR family transcriptional regulator